MIEIATLADKQRRKFKEGEFYDLSPSKRYFLLPFRFHRLTKTKEVIVNDIGDYIVVPEGTVEKLVTRRISKADNEELYGDLIANFFLSEEEVPELYNVISTRYRTKKSFLD